MSPPIVPLALLVIVCVVTLIVYFTDKLAPVAAAPAWKAEPVDEEDEEEEDDYTQRQRAYHGAAIGHIKEARHIAVRQCEGALASRLDVLATATIEDALDDGDTLSEHLYLVLCDLEHVSHSEDIAKNVRSAKSYVETLALTRYYCANDNDEGSDEPPSAHPKAA